MVSVRVIRLERFPKGEKLSAQTTRRHSMFQRNLEAGGQHSHAQTASKENQMTKFEIEFERSRTLLEDLAKGSQIGDAGADLFEEIVPMGREEGSVSRKTSLLFEECSFQDEEKLTPV
jgi:hypothetical protein